MMLNKYKDETVIQCEKKFAGAASYIYYDSGRKIWKVGVEVGSDSAQLAVHSQAKSPEQIKAVWSVAAEASQWKPAPNVTVKCNEHDPDTYHAQDAHVHRPLDFLEDSGCVSFRATKGCNPNGDREPESDRPCREQISKPSVSGFCECLHGRRESFACGHATFDCKRVCNMDFPMVLAESSQDWQSSQVCDALAPPPRALPLARLQQTTTHNKIQRTLTSPLVVSFYPSRWRITSSPARGAMLRRGG
jgi:hypothetical protein